MKRVEKMDNLQRISHETMVFMRGNYHLDEIGNGKNELKFKTGKRTILTIYIHEDKYVFLVIFGKKERELFENQRNEFSTYVQKYYDDAKTWHDGKWVFFDVNTLEQLNEIKKLIFIKKKPNRKNFSKDKVVYTQCGHRCDLCIHYSKLDDTLRIEIEPHLVKMWNQEDWSMRCGGCYSQDCYCKNDLCGAKKCAFEKGITECIACDEYPCIKATVADYRSMIHTEIHYADEITWGILPYVPWQYERRD